MVTPDEFKQVMRNWASTVTIVTTRASDRIHGLTATAFSSLTVNPPEIFVSIYKRTITHPMIEQSGIFCVNLLAPEMQHLSDRFAGRIPNEERFAGVAFHGVATGAPVLDDALAFLDCRVERALDTGDHTIFVGRVLAAGVQRSDRLPLLYYQGQYHLLGEIAREFSH